MSLPTLDIATLHRMRTALRQAGDPELTLEQDGVRLRMVPAEVTDQAPAPPRELVLAKGIGLLRLAPPLGTDPLAPVGSNITPGQTVAQLQVGAALLPVIAETSGRVTEVLAENGALVGYDTPLFAL